MKVSRRILHDFDLVYVFTSLAIAACGVLSIYSVGEKGLWIKQVIWIGCGLVLMFFAMWDYHKLLRFSPIFYGITIFLMLVVIVHGKVVNGANAWLAIGGFGFQPSELAKMATIMMLTFYLTKQKKDPTAPMTIMEMAIGGAIVMVPVAVIMAQHDMGTALTFLPFMFVMFFLSGMRWWLVLATLLMIPFLLVGTYKYALKDYQKQRIDAIIRPDTVDPRGYGYHTIQSKVAIGSGGLFGKGLKHGTQSQLRFLPEPQTDFIAAAFGEEMGFAGIMIVLGLILFWLLRAIQIAQLSRDRMGMMMIMGIVTLFFAHVITNLGMVVGFMPVLGIPLPLMSYGGSSIFSTFIGIGLILNVRLHRFVN